MPIAPYDPFPSNYHERNAAMAACEFRSEIQFLMDKLDRIKQIITISDDKNTKEILRIISEKKS